MRSDSPYHPLHRAAIALAPVLRRQHRCAAGYAKEQHLQHKGHLPARDEAASAAWLTKDSMITSAELTAASIKFCRAIGPVMRSVRA